MISERIKHNSYNNRFAQLYFWRTHDQSEIDLVEEEDGELRAFEFKRNPAKKSRMPKSFANAYGNMSTTSSRHRITGILSCRINNHTPEPKN
ncbi:MAG: hypothetical protein IJY31_05415 [Muribaculaceae bacterium]|nr:hypothetical protein [Muribaculaceae bacterium]